MHMPLVRHQESYFNHPVVENYVKAKGKFNIFSYTNPASLSMIKIILLKCSGMHKWNALFF